MVENHLNFMYLKIEIPQGYNLFMLSNITHERTKVIESEYLSLISNNLHMSEPNWESHMSEYLILL